MVMRYGGRCLERVWLALGETISVDIRSLAFARIVLGALLAITFVNFALYAPQLMSDSGVFPREMSLEVTRWREFSFLLANGSAEFQRLVLIGSSIFAFLFACNIIPRTSLFVCWVMFYSVTFRSTEYNFGLCPAMLGVLFWGLFAPWHRAPSWPIISMRDRSAADIRVRSWALVGMFLTCAAVSYGAGLAKFKNFGAWFVNYQALELDLVYYTNVNPITRVLGSIPYFFQLASPLVVLVELGAPLLLLIPVYRSALVTLALTMATVVYVGIALSIHVGIFPLIPLVGFYLLIRGGFWEWCARRTSLRGLSYLARYMATAASLAGRQANKIAKAIVGCLGVALVGCFALKAIDDQTGKVIPAAVIEVADNISRPVFDLFQVRTNWGWIYGGALRNRFLVVRLQGEGSAYLVNTTSVDYQGVLYNYFMNYANSILRGKDDPRRLYHYARFMCGGGLTSTGLTSYREAVRSIELFEVPDPENKLKKLSADDQPQLQAIIKGLAPFFSFACTSGNTVWDRGGDIKHTTGVPRPGSAVDLPILGWSQDYGALRLDRAVDGAPISIRGRIFQRGFGTHANSRIRLRTAGMKRFTAFVGIDDEKGFSRYASVVARVEGDGRELYRSPVLSTAMPEILIDLDISGVSELVLISDDAAQGLGTNTNCDDHVSWADPIIE